MIKYRWNSPLFFLHSFKTEFSIFNVSLFVLLISSYIIMSRNLRIHLAIRTMFLLLFFSEKLFIHISRVERKYFSVLSFYTFKVSTLNSIFLAYFSYNFSLHFVFILSQAAITPSPLRDLHCICIIYIPLCEYESDSISNLV